jgi:hypothetical protein
VNKAKTVDRPHKGFCFDELYAVVYLNYFDRFLLLESWTSLFVVLKDLAVLKLSFGSQNTLVIVLFVDEAKDVVGYG